MPGPDDTIRWLQQYARERGLTTKIEQLSQDDLQALRLEAETARQALRGLDALLNSLQRKKHEDSAAISHVQV